MSTIGVLVRGASGWQQFPQLFPEALRELGYIEGKNIRFEFPADQGEMSHLPNAPDMRARCYLAPRLCENLGSNENERRTQHRERGCPNLA
jgi:hypothetical protein